MVDVEYVARDEAGVHIQVVLQRQCAWCLRLMDEEGVPISAGSYPKLYEATHGMCRECGMHWMEDIVYREAQPDSHDDELPEDNVKRLLHRMGVLFTRLSLALPSHVFVTHR